MATDDIPENIYRNTLDLNRFSNSVAKKLVVSYNNIILETIEKLKKIEEMPLAKRPSYKAARLRSLLKQLKKSLNKWSDKSSDEIIQDLDGIAKLQSEFAINQLKKALPAGTASVINPINVTDAFAKSVVNTNPLQLGAALLSDDLKGKITGKFSLTAKQGALINLPNGKSVKKSFRGLAASQSELFGRTVREGMLTGETTDQIASRLKGNLSFNQRAKSVKQIALAGGSATKMANHQIQTIVHSSVQQVANTASQSVYKANSDITKKYRYVATLDTRTSPICRDLDGQEFEYGKGPEPLQHFRCRSTTVAVIDYEGLGVPPPSKPLGKRAAEGGSVPAGTSYGKWLSQQSQGKKAQALGKSKVKYFNAMSKKYGPDQAIKKFVAKDGSEKTLAQLQKTYGKTPTTSKRLKPTPKVVKAPVKTVLKKGLPSATDGKPIPLKPAAKTSPKPITENKHIRKLNKISDGDIMADYKTLRSDLEFKQAQAQVVISKGRMGKVGAKSLAAGEKNFKEVTEALKALDKRYKATIADWRAKNLPQVSGSPKSLKKLGDKELLKTLDKYEKELAIRKKRISPKDKYAALSLKNQQQQIEKIRDRINKNLPPTDWEANVHTPMGYIYDRQGFNGAPTRVKSLEDLKKSKDLLKGGNGETLVMYRGVERKKFADQFKGIGLDGGQHYPGQGIYGNGTYAASRGFYTTGKDAVQGAKGALMTASAYAGADTKRDIRNRVTAFGFKKNAKILKWPKGVDTYDGANSLWREWEEAIHDQASQLTGLSFNTTGEAAAALGYDAYQVPAAGAQDEDYWVIFNRSALVVADDPF